MSRFRPRRTAGITLGTLVILGVGLYGPATLLGPSPAVEAHVTTHSAPPLAPVAPALPDEGSSAIVLDSTGSPLASAGHTDVVPMAGIAKIVTALVVLEAKPLEVGRAGPAMPISLEDYRSYIDNANADNIAVTVLPGETWTEREMLEAMVLASSNNHAESLARWAYGSRAAFLDAASGWLIENGLTSTRLADETGLSEQSAGSAIDLARLSALAMANPALREILTEPAGSVLAGRGVSNRTAYLPDLGVTSMSHSYTDAAGICLLFAGTVTVDDEPFTFYSAFLGLPDWDALDTATAKLMESAVAGVRVQKLVTEGDVFATFTAEWGDSAHAVAMTTHTQLAWQLDATQPGTVTTTPFSTNPRGAQVGTLSLTSNDGPITLPLTLDHSITGPGPGWRLLHPVPLISTLLDSL